MQELEFITLFPVRVHVFRPKHGGNAVEIFIGDIQDGSMWRQGTMEKRDGVWIGHTTNGAVISGNDIAILGDIIDNLEHRQPIQDDIRK